MGQRKGVISLLLLSALILFSCGQSGQIGQNDTNSILYNFKVISPALPDIIIETNSGMIFRLLTPANNTVVASNHTCKVQIVSNVLPFIPNRYRYLYLVVDGVIDFSSTTKIVNTYMYDKTETTQALVLNTYSLKNGAHTVQPWLKVFIGSGVNKYIIGNPVTVYVSNSFKVIKTNADPAGDWHGLKSDLMLPVSAGADGTYLEGSQDITNVLIGVAGGNLRLTFFMRRISTAWSPHLGFDHVSFQIFFDSPSATGLTDLPKQNAKLPGGMANWDYELFAEGWSSAIYSSAGATKSAFGATTGSPDIFVDVAMKTIEFLIYADAIGGPVDLKNWKIYVTTFDYDGTASDFRPIATNSTTPDHQFHSISNILFLSNTYTNAKILDYVGPIDLGSY